MRFYLTYCSQEKAPSLKQTDFAVTPDRLYTDPGVQQFMEKCQKKNVGWGILSDLYGVYLSNERHVWYEKHPDTVTPQEEELIIKDFNHKLGSYDEIFFYARSDAFHPFYKRVLDKTALANRVRIIQHIEMIL